jgi:hypothetical protein
LKCSVVKPLFKKGDKKDIKNYIPISLLTSYKMFEKVIYIRLSKAGGRLQRSPTLKATLHGRDSPDSQEGNHGATSRGINYEKLLRPPSDSTNGH